MHKPQLFVFLLLASSISFAQETVPSLTPTEQVVTSTPTPTPTLAAAPKLEWSGDLRYRMARSKESADDERPYQQLRARLGLKADVNESVQAIVRLATGTSATSTNQTLGDAKEPGMPRRNFGLDLAYIDAKLFSLGRAWVGRTANPFWAPAKSQIVFDSDLAFEGLALKWEPQWSQSSAFVNLGGFMISENYTTPSDVVDTALVGLQAGYSLKASGTWTVHVANYQYLNIQGRPITSIDKDAKTDAFSYPYDRFKGNTIYPNDPLLPPDSRKYFFQNNYVLYESGLEWKTKIEPVELSLFYDWVLNDRASDQGKAHEYGVGVKWARVSLGYAQTSKQSDAVVGAFTDSDMNGGGTDNKGSRWSLACQLSKNAQLALTDFRATRGVDSVARDFAATQLDLVVSF